MCEEKTGKSEILNDEMNKYECKINIDGVLDGNSVIATNIQLIISLLFCSGFAK